MLLPGCRPTEGLPVLEKRYGEASVFTKGEDLTVSTGRVERTWKWTGRGLATVSYKNLETGKEWCSPGHSHPADWQIPGLVTEGGRLVSLSATGDNDQGFTSDHLRVTAEIEYPASQRQLRYDLWIYPGASGLRTQVSVRAAEATLKQAASFVSNDGDREGVVEALPVDPQGRHLNAWGYADGTQWLNSPAKPIYKEHTEVSMPSAGEITWASGMDISEGGEHLILVKESNKCFNTEFAANNGRFAWDGSGIRNTGTGWLPEEMAGAEYRSCWAAWSILAHGDASSARLALKQFDRLRYPVDPERDIYILANTWGSSVAKTDSRLAARESNILREIESASDLGIDIQQVDDGWQGMIYAQWKEYESGRVSWRPADSVSAPADSPAAKEFGSTRIPMYPRGWSNIREHARKHRVELGLWVYGRSITLEDLVWNHENGGFTVFKYDFFRMDSMQKAHEHLAKIRRFILASGHRVRTNWDVTGTARIGYYLGRDLGAIYLENRKTQSPDIVVYKPYLVLRDAWQISRYVNLNKFEITVQNADRVTRQPDAYGERSDSWKHPHDYCFAQTMMGTPIFFQETQLYSQQAREQLKPLIRIYREHRAALYSGYPFPIGDKPDNKSWSGFQNYNPANEVSFISVFRQIENGAEKKEMEIRFYKPGTRLRLTNLETDHAEEFILGNGRNLEFSIPEAPGYRFFKLEKMNPL